MLFLEVHLDHEENTQLFNHNWALGLYYLLLEDLPLGLMIMIQSRFIIINIRIIIIIIIIITVIIIFSEYIEISKCVLSWLNANITSISLD